MGLETAHPDALERLNKRMTLDQFRRAAGAARRRDVALRVFVLVAPPFVPASEQAAVAGPLGRSCVRVRRVGRLADPDARRQRRRRGAGRRGPVRRPDARRVRGGDGPGDRSARAGACSPTCGTSNALRRAPRVSARARPGWHAMNLTQRPVARVSLRGVLARGGSRMTGRPLADVDVAVIGAGFGGALTALALRRLGRSVVAHRARTPSALCHRRVVDAAGQHPASRSSRRSTTCRAWRRCRSGARGGGVSGSAGGPQARVQLLSPRARSPVRRRRLARATAAGGRQPARRDRRHALVSPGVRRVPDARGAGGRRRAARPDAHRSRPARGRRGAARPHPRRRRAHADARASSSMPAARAGRSIGCSSSKKRRPGGCPRPKGSTRTSRASRAGTRQCGPRPACRIRWTPPRCTRCFLAGGSGFCGSTTASRARAPP